MQRRENDVTEQLLSYFSRRPWGIVRGFLFQYGVIQGVFLPWIFILMKVRHCETRNVGLVGQQRKMTIQTTLNLVLLK